MFSQTFGHRTYGFGLTWITTKELPARAVKDAQNDEDAFLGVYIYHALINTTPHGVVDGYALPSTLGFIIEPSKTATRYSAAHALAMASEDGLYLARLQDGSYWYCGIRDGRVIRDSDSIASLESLATFVQQMHAATGLPIYTTHQIEGLSDARSFDLEAILNLGKSAPLTPLYDRNLRKAYIYAAIGIAFSVAVASYSLGHKHVISPVEMLKQQRLNYVLGVSQIVNQLPLNNTWMVDAYRLSRSSFPPYIDGFSLNTIECRPSKCTANYNAPLDGIYAVSPLIDRYGAVQFQSDRSLSVAINLKTQVLNINLDNIKNLPVASVAFADWLGAVPLWSDGGAIKGTPLVRDLGTDLGAANVGLPGIAMEQVSVHAPQYLDPMEMRQLVTEGSFGGFEPVSGLWTFGDSSAAPYWELTFERVHAHGN